MTLLCFLLLAAESGWTTWAPRTEIAPRTFQDAVHHRGPGPSLAISGNSNPAAFGGWERNVPVEAGKWYRCRAWYRTEGVQFEAFQVLARLDWQRGNARRAGQPDYVYTSRRDGEWTETTAEAQAPANATSVNLQLLLVNAPAATVWWDGVELESIPDPGPRRVTVASLNFRPSKTRTAEENVRAFADAVDLYVTGKPDVVLLPEGITLVGNGKKYLDVAEPIPGPSTKSLGELARRRHTYIVAGIYEREGQTMYNTAVLIGRNGDFIGKYRKVYIPREEMEGGITPGSDYPVFRTDFGKVGLMICWDVQYADPARALALRGAELILLPIWGGNQVLGKARAIENHVFLAASGYDYPTYIVDPDGEVLSVAERNGAAVATIDLNRRYRDEWLGDMRARFMKELRLDLNALPR